MAQQLAIPYTEVRKNFYKTWRSKLIQGRPSLDVPEIPFDQLSVKQKRIVNIVTDHLANTEPKEPLQAIIQGEAGCGKSQVLKHIKYELQKKCRENSEFNFKVVSYTALAAYQLGGETIHSAFAVPVCESDSDLRKKLDEPMELSRERYLQSIKFVLVDEASMVGKKLLYYLHKLFCKVHPESDGAPFGGKSIILAGDDSQLAPIGDFPLWTPVDKRIDGTCLTLRKEMQEISRIYRGIKCVFLLDVSYRQAGIEQLEFLQLLSRIRRGECNEKDFAVIRSRMKKNLSREEESAFQDVIYAFPKRANVRMRNHEMLHTQFPPEEIAVLKNGMYDLELAVGCPVIIRKNLCSKAGVLNGSKAVVVDIVQPTEDEIQCGIPEMILVEVEGYQGNVIVTTANGKGLPIFREQSSEFDEIMEAYEKSLVFPLDLGYSFTIHKIQGKEFEKLAICLGSREMVPNLDYVAFSRVRNLQSLMIVDDWLYINRVVMNHTRNWRIMQQMEEKRLKEAEAQFQLDTGL